MDREKIGPVEAAKCIIYLITQKDIVAFRGIRK